MVRLAGETTLSLGGSFQVPTPGDHLMMFQQDSLGIEDSEQGERFICQLEVVDDPDENENGAQVRISTPLDWDNVEQIVCDILACAGVDKEIEDIVNRAYPNNNFDVFSPEVQEQIQLKLPGQVVQCKTSIHKFKPKDSDEVRTYGRIVTMELVPSDAPVAAQRTSKAGSNRRTTTAPATTRDKGR